MIRNLIKSGLVCLVLTAGCNEPLNIEKGKSPTVKRESEKNKEDPGYTVCETKSEGAYNPFIDPEFSETTGYDPNDESKETLSENETLSEDKNLKRYSEYNEEDRKIIDLHNKYITRIKKESEEKIFKETESEAFVDPVGFDWDNETILDYWKNKDNYKSMKEADSKFREKYSDTRLEGM